MPAITAKNDGQARFVITHGPSGQSVLSDPPAGHGGEGASFAPTDLLDAALLACTGAMISIKTASLGLDPKGISIAASHEMDESARHVASIQMDIQVAFAAEERQKKSIIAAAKGCPVRNSLSDKTSVRLRFQWADGQTDIVGE